MRKASMANGQRKEQKSGTSKRHEKSNDQFILMRSWNPNIRNTMAELYTKAIRTLMQYVQRKVRLHHK